MAMVEASLTIRRASVDVFTCVMTPANAPRYDLAKVRPPLENVMRHMETREQPV